MSKVSNILMVEVGGIIGYRGSFRRTSMGEFQYYQGIYPDDNREFGELLYEYLVDRPIKKVGFTTSESLEEDKWYLVYLKDIGKESYEFKGKPYALYYMPKYKTSRFIDDGFYLRFYGVEGMDSYAEMRGDRVGEFFINNHYKKSEFASAERNHNKKFGFAPLKKPAKFINWYKKNPFEVKS